MNIKYFLFFIFVTSLIYLFFLKNRPNPQSLPTAKNINNQALESPDFYFQKALKNQNNIPLAIEYYNLALTAATAQIKANPKNPDFYFQRGWLYATLMYSYPSFIPPAISDLNYSCRGAVSAPAQCNVSTNQILANLYTAAGDLPNALIHHQYLQNTDQVQSIKNLIQQSQVGAKPPTPVLDSKLLEASAPNLIIASPNATSPFSTASSANTNALSGEITLPKNSTSVTLNNKNITSSSQVYISVVSGGKNQTISVASKTVGSAELRPQTPIPEDVIIKWWVIK